MILYAGDVVSFELPATSQDYFVSGKSLNVNGGKCSNLYLNGELLFSAPGATATVCNVVDIDVDSVELLHSNNSTSTTCDVHWHNNGDLNTTWSDTTYSKTLPGSCFSAAGHSHNVTGTCPTHTDTRTVEGQPCEGRHKHGNSYTGTPDWFHCCMCCPSCNHDHSKTESYTVYDCGSYTNIWKRTCGKQHGEVIRPDSALTSTNHAAVMPSWSTNINTQYTVGTFLLQLDECNLLFNDNLNCSKVYFNNNAYNVVILNDTVVYCKHGMI